MRVRAVSAHAGGRGGSGGVGFGPGIVELVRANALHIGGAGSVGGGGRVKRSPLTKTPRTPFRVLR